jgi:hypothetical protein
MATNPIKDPAFRKTLQNLLSMKPKHHSEMKVGKRAQAKKQQVKKAKSK